MTASLSVYTGPAESLRVRFLFYLAEGAMIGAVFFFMTYLLLFLLSLFGAVTAAGGWFIIIIILSLLLGRGVRSVWTTMLALQPSSHPPVYREWTEVRRWPWVILLAITIAASLFGILHFLWRWERGTYTPNAAWMTFGTLLFGFALFTVADAYRTRYA